MGNKQTTMDYQILKSMRADDTLIELVHNVHCERYELVIDGIPVFNSKEMIHVDHEYQMEMA